MRTRRVSKLLVTGLLLAIAVLAASGCSPNAQIPAYPLQLVINRMGNKTLNYELSRSVEFGHTTIIAGTKVKVIIPYRNVRLGGDDVAYSDIWMNVTGIEATLDGRFKVTGFGIVNGHVGIHGGALSTRFDRSEYGINLEDVKESVRDVNTDMKDVNDLIENDFSDYRYSTHEEDLLGWVKEDLVPQMQDAFRAADFYDYATVQSEYSDLQGGYKDMTAGVPGSPDTGFACDSAHAVHPSDTPNEKGCAFIKNGIDLRNADLGTPDGYLTARIKLMAQKRRGVAGNVPGAWLKLAPALGGTQETWIPITSDMVPRDNKWYTFSVRFNPKQRTLPYLKFLVNLNRTSQEKRFPFDWIKVDYVRFAAS